MTQLHTGSLYLAVDYCDTVWDNSTHCNSSSLLHSLQLCLSSCPLLSLCIIFLCHPRGSSPHFFPHIQEASSSRTYQQMSQLTHTFILIVPLAAITHVQETSPPSRNLTIMCSASFHIFWCVTVAISSHFD